MRLSKESIQLCTRKHNYVFVNTTGQFGGEDKLKHLDKEVFNCVRIWHDRTVSGNLFHVIGQSFEEFLLEMLFEKWY